MEGFSRAYAWAQGALPDLSDCPQPFRRGFRTRCRHCGREIRYPKGEWMSDAGARVRVPIGVGLPDRAARERLCLRPHADWHWGAQARWHEWAPVGGLGLITWDRTLDGGQGTRRKIVSRLL